MSGTLWPKAKGGKRSKAVIIEAMIAAEALEEEAAANPPVIIEAMIATDALEEAAAAHVPVVDALWHVAEEDGPIEVEREESLSDDQEFDEEEPCNPVVMDDAFIVELLTKTKTTNAGRQFLVHYKDLARANDRWFSEEDLVEDGHAHHI